MVAVALLLLLPAQALAAVCLKDQFNHNIFIAALAPVDGIYVVVGEYLFGDLPCVSAPLSGSGHVKADGNFHFGFIINSFNNAGCNPYSIQATLNAPLFTSGAGFVQNLINDADRGPLTLTPGTCPASIPN